MKNQTIEIDFTVMLYAGVMYTGLVFSGWLLLRLTIACFKLPALLREAEPWEEKLLDTAVTGETYVTPRTFCGFIGEMTHDPS